MDDKELRELMKELCRLVLRQADTVAYLQMDLGFMLFLKTSMKPKLPVEEETTKQWAIVNNLYKTAQAWHAKKSSDPDSLTNTLRTTLVYCMMTTLQERITALETSQEDVRRLESLGIMENGCFLYMRWNQERKCHEKTQQEHLTLAQAKEHEAVIVKHLVFPRVVLRFHALRKLTSEMASEVRDPQQVLGVPTHLFSIRAPRFQFGDAPHRGQPSSKQAGTVPSGESHRRSGVQAVVDEATVKAIKLGNTQDFCYANASLLALLWLFAQASLDPAPPHAPFQQALQKVFTCRGRLCHLWQISSWRHAVHPWLARGQQDAAEFLQSISR